MKKATVSAEELYRHPGAAMDAARNRAGGVIVTSRGRPQVAMLSIRDYEALQKARRHLGVLREAEAARAKVLAEGGRDA